jgi:ABC-type antimicrobial peptide transport system permease subunit
METLRTALHQVLANKGRSAFPIAGVVIGAAAVILLISAVSGLKKDIVGQIASLGANTIMVKAGAPPEDTGDPAAMVMKSVDSASLASSDIYLSDMQTIKDGESNVTNLTPVIFGGSETIYPTDDENNSLKTTLIGTDEAYPDVNNWKVGQGEFFSGGDKNAVLGTAVVDKLWGEGNYADAIDKTITVKSGNGQSMEFTVVGVMELRPKAITGNPNNQIFIPVTVAQELYSNDGKVDIGERIHEIDVIAADSAKPADVASSIDTLLVDAGRSNFYVTTQEEIRKSYDKIVNIFNTFIAGITVIALFESAMGVLTIMYVSVKERTKEIGTRKAAGATSGKIIRQFLAESVILCLIGSVIGIPLGIIGQFGLSYATTTELQIWSIPLAFCALLIIGALSGMFPAWQAAKVPPVTAMRAD